MIQFPPPENLFAVLSVDKDLSLNSAIFRNEQMLRVVAERFGNAKVPFADLESRVAKALNVPQGETRVALIAKALRTVPSFMPHFASREVLVANIIAQPQFEKHPGMQKILEEFAQHFAGKVVEDEFPQKMGDFLTSRGVILDGFLLDGLQQLLIQHCIRQNP